MAARPSAKRIAPPAAPAPALPSAQLKGSGQLQIKNCFMVLPVAQKLATRGTGPWTVLQAMPFLRLFSSSMHATGRKQGATLLKLYRNQSSAGGACQAHGRPARFACRKPPSRVCMHVRGMPPMHHRDSFHARGSSESILMLGRCAACLLQVILGTALKELCRTPPTVSEPQPMTGAEAAAPLPPASSTPKGSKRKGEQEPTSPQPVGWVDKQIPRLKHQCTPEQAVTLKAKSSLAIEQASSPPPKAQPAPGAAGEKRAHARNPEHPQRRLSEPEREACYLAYVIAAHRLGMTVPALGSKPELDDNVVAEALRIVRSTALVEGVPAAGSGKDSWLRHSQSNTLRGWVTRRITDGQVADKYAGTQHAPKYPITEEELRN